MIEKLLEGLVVLTAGGSGAFIMHLLHKRKENAEAAKIAMETKKVEAEVTHTKIHNTSEIAKLWADYVAEIKEQQKNTRDIVEKLEEKYDRLNELYEQLRIDYFELRQENIDLRKKVAALEVENQTLKKSVEINACKYNTQTEN